MKKIKNDVRLVTVASLLLIHERANAFFGINISSAELYTLAAIALFVVLLVVVAFVFVILKLIRVCQVKNSFRPAWLALTVIIIAGITAAYFHDNAVKRAQEHSRKYYEQVGKIIPDNKPTDRVLTTKLPQPPPQLRPQLTSPVIKDPVGVTEITGKRRVTATGDTESR